VNTEFSVTKVSSVATYAGSSAAVYFGLTANEIAAFGGLIVAIIGVLVTWYYKHQSLQVLRASQASRRMHDDE
jgi:hypothetical protein